MVGAVAGLASEEGVEVLGMDAAAVSYPGFVADIAGSRAAERKGADGHRDRRPRRRRQSTVARALAERLHFTYLDSGAMYRSVALLALRAPDGDPGRLAAGAVIELGGPRGAVVLNGEDVSGAIRTPEVSARASVLAAVPAVREALVAKQRALLEAGDWVAEGRDIGTVVAPGAELKVYLDADPAERARRRAEEIGAEAGSVLAEQAIRDERDRSRAESPLRAAEGALVLDTSGLDVAEVVERIAQLAGTPAGGA